MEGFVRVKLWRLIFLVFVLALAGSVCLGAISSEERDGATIYILNQEELDQTIIVAEQKNLLEKELQKALASLEREKKWKKFTLSFTLPVAGYLVLREVNPQWGPVVGVLSGATAAWLLNLILD